MIKTHKIPMMSNFPTDTIWTNAMISITQLIISKSKATFQNKYQHGRVQSWTHLKMQPNSKMKMRSNSDQQPQDPFAQVSIIKPPKDPYESSLKHQKSPTMGRFHFQPSLMAPRCPFIPKIMIFSAIKLPQCGSNSHHVCFYTPMWFAASKQRMK